MWRALIQALTADAEPIGGEDPGPNFFPGATAEQLAAVEQVVGYPLPRALRELLGESNGVLVDFGQHLIWNTDELMRYNQPPNGEPDTGWFGYHGHVRPRLLFFGDAGVDGIGFGFAITDDGVVSEQIYAWNPIGDEQVYKASSLRRYIETWLTAQLTV